MLKELKENHKDLYYNIVGLLQDMKNGGGSIVWALNMSESDNKEYKNLEKALKHINIACDILQGTLYPKN